MTLEAQRKAKIEAALSASKARLEAFVEEAKAAGADAVLVLRFCEEQTERRLVEKEVGAALAEGFRLVHLMPARPQDLVLGSTVSVKPRGMDRYLKIYTPKGSPVPNTADNPGASWLIVYWS